jgi:HAD superfamily hydrolase (TIGR01549 family)
LNIPGLGEIEAVGFDIDGTLYKQWRLHLLMAFHFLRYNQFFLHYGLVRNEMHHMERLENFSEVQAELLARRIHCSVQETELRLKRIVYDGLSGYFNTIPCCKYVPETFRAFHDAGLKIAVLSDFPPEQKRELWGLKKYCDVILGTEDIGALKPAVYPFNVMAEKLGVVPGHILYIGNSVKYDVYGSKNAGMKSAFFEPFWRRLFHLPLREADISFNDYRQLQKIVLQYKK